MEIQMKKVILLLGMLLLVASLNAQEFKAKTSSVCVADVYNGESSDWGSPIPVHSIITFSNNTFIIYTDKIQEYTTLFNLKPMTNPGGTSYIGYRVLSQDNTYCNLWLVRTKDGTNFLQVDLEEVSLAYSFEFLDIVSE